MSWVQTYTGLAFYPLTPRMEDIRIEDIAHSLAMTCRYNGHCLRFYSVAEHSVHLSRTVDGEHARWALLHDAAEAYIGDMVRPIKSELPDFLYIEGNVNIEIAARFNLPWPMPEQVKEHDTRILIDERDQNMVTPPQSWQLQGFTPLGVKLQCWAPAQAEQEFLSRYRQLFN